MRQTLTPGTDRSGSIVAAGAAQTVADANSARIHMSFQNTSSSPMRLAEDGNDAASNSGYLIQPGDLVEVGTTRRISVWCAVANATFESTER